MDNSEPNLPNKESQHDVSSRLQAILETAVDGIITIDNRGIVEFVNPATCKIFGYDRDEIIGHNISLLMPQPYHDQHDSYIHNYKSTGIKKIIGIGREVTGRRKNGSVFPFWLSISEVQLEGRQLFTGIVHDISDQKRAEESVHRINNDLENRLGERTEKLSELVNKLMATSRQFEREVQERKVAENALKIVQAELREALQKEKELGELKNRFISMASHEFRTPLSTIMSSADLMRAYENTEDQPKRERHHQKIQRAIENLSNILNDFLSLSRLEEGLVTLQIEDFVLEDFCNAVVDDMQGVLKNGQNIVIIHDLPPQFIAHLDKKAFQMVMGNLISNASKYSDEGKNIICRIAHDPLTISIQDEGIGIPEADQRHMFDRFFRASNVTNIKGTGLGLNIVRRYIEMMGGTISFVSEEGKGSVFTIVFAINN